MFKPILKRERMNAHRLHPNQALSKGNPGNFHIKKVVVGMFNPYRIPPLLLPGKHKGLISKNFEGRRGEGKQDEKVCNAHDL